MQIKTFGVIVLCVINLAITAVYYLPTMPIMVDAWGSVNTSGNYTTYTGVPMFAQFGPVLFMGLPFLLVVFAIIWGLRKKHGG